MEHETVSVAGTIAEVLQIILHPEPNLLSFWTL